MLAREILRGDSAAIGEVLKEFRLSERSQKAYVQERFLAGMWEFLSGSSSWWNWVGYRVVFTANIFSYPIKPVCLLKDDDRKESYLPSPKRFKENELKEMDILRQQIRRGTEIQALPSGDGVALPGLIESFRDEDLKRRAVFLVNAWSSYYVARLNLRDKAGRSRWLGRRPRVRGVAMNPVDHPMGGGEGRASGGHPRSRKGLLAKGYKTRAPRNSSDRLIVNRRK